ncbi:hypothetical protein NKJ28_00290 [Mesorhizobium sp. M0145]|uniref:hypothetical protein n=1 Tax=Mesorhizobium sp. M0145 TaxID=2956895 RepID=UPI00333B56D8
MADIETTYRGHLIRYGENSDEWYCRDLEVGGGSHVSLAKLKAKIDKMYLDLRRKAAVKVFEVNGGYSSKPSITEATIIEYVRPFAEKDWKGVVGRTRHKVATVAQRNGSERASRAEKELSDLMPDTSEAQAAFAEALRLAEIAAEAQKAATEALNRIPRLTLDDIAELVRIKESETA